MRQEEIWKKVEWAPDYKISSWGNVKSYKQDKINGKILKISPDPKTGYILVRIYDKEGKVKYPRVHRLVAEAFIPNPENKPDVNHIDEDKSNNYYKNLNWMTRKENINYGTHNERSAQSKWKRVRCIETGKIYNSHKEARDQTGIGNIYKACNGIYSHAGGFHWEYIK